jgi:hypothetical protein
MLAIEKLDPDQYSSALEAGIEDDAAIVRISAAKPYIDVFGDREGVRTMLLDIVDQFDDVSEEAARVLIEIAPERAFVDLLPRVPDLYRNLQVPDTLFYLNDLVKERDRAFIREQLERLDAGQIERARDTIRDSTYGEDLATVLEEESA